MADDYKRKYYNTHKPYLCIDCGAPVERKVARCKDCAKEAIKHRQTYVRTDEHKALMSSRLSGKTHNYAPASKNPEVAKKISESWTKEKRELQSNMVIERNKSIEQRLKYGSVASNNPMWIDGRATNVYARGWTKRLKQEVFERTSHLCDICGANAMDIHHKDFKKDNNSLDNLQPLCRSCHKRIHIQRDNNKEVKI
ncbi:MAG: HNH endonuclease signature motif containing protein [Endomicrobiaceae bacterium]|nr:HNH endonuclease signature motif containing protein [Endomicrobiaceae bacterium]